MDIDGRKEINIALLMPLIHSRGSGIERFSFTIPEHEFQPHSLALFTSTFTADCDCHGTIFPRVCHMLEL
jgi:hypothetical protein